MELLKDGGSDKRHIREGLTGSGGQRGESEGEESAEWNGVSEVIQIECNTNDSKVRTSLYTQLFKKS